MGPGAINVAQSRKLGVINHQLGNGIRGSKLELLRSLKLVAEVRTDDNVEQQVAL